MIELAKMMRKFLKLCLILILSFTLELMVSAQQSYAGPPGKSCTCGYVGQLFVRSFDNQYYKFVPCRGGLPVFLYNGYLDSQRTYKFSLYVNVSTQPTAARNSKIVTWVDYSVTAVINYKGKQTMMKLLHHNYNAYPLRHGANAEIPELLPYRERSNVYIVYPVGLGTKTGQGSKTFFTIPGNSNPIAELEIEPLYGNVYLIVNDVQASGTNTALCGRCDQRVNRATSALELSRMNTGAANSLNIPICNDYSIDYVNINAPVPCLSGAGNAYCKYLCDPNVLKYCPECRVLSHKCYSDLYKKNLHWCPLIQSVVAKIFHENKKYLAKWQAEPYCYLDRTMTDPLLCKANFQSNATTEMMGKSDYKGCRAPARNLQLKAILGSACYCQKNLLEHSSDKAHCVHSKSCQCATTVYRTNWYLILTRQAFMTQGCKQRCMCIPRVHNQLTYYEFDCAQYPAPQNSMCTPENEAYKMIKNSMAVQCSAKAFSVFKYQVYARVPEQVWCKPGFSGCAMADEPCQDIQECDYMRSGRKYGNVTFEPCKPGYTCENTVGSFVCRPPPGVIETPAPFTCPSVVWSMIVGPNAVTEVPVNLEPFCDKRPCSPHADCTYDWRRLCNVTCTCKPGFSSGNTGYECERPCSKNDEYYCAKNNNELKTKKCILDERGQKKCVCKTGFRVNPLTRTCIDIDECAECKHQCVQHSMCKNEIGGYQCVCLPGYFGNAIDECKEVDECTSGIAECDSNADCINKRPGYECRCRLGWQGAPSPGTISQPCVDTNECVVMPQACGTYTKCINKPGSYVCVCLPGNFRKADSKNCEDIDECTETSYQDQPCNSNANCINTPGSYNCECKSGFVGDGFSCKADDSYCRICQPGTTRCILTPAQNRYMCQCLPGYVKVMGSDTACQVEPKCGDPNKNQCDKLNAVCINDASRLEGYACRCKVGFMGDGRTCYRPNPCESNPCLVVPFSQCRKTPMGTFTCICIKGYTQQGQKCIETSIVVRAHNCSRCDPLKQTCVPDDRDPKLFTCKCNLGYMMMPDGQCHNIDECLRLDLNNCDPEFASCIDRVPHLHNGKQFECFCKRGFTGNGLVNGCKDVEECTQLNMRVCPNANTYCVNTVGSYRCVCGKGFEELTPNMPEPVACVDVPECERGIAQCPSHSDCINTIGSYRCQCSKGFAPQGPACADVDECLSQPCNLTVSSCKNTMGSFVCICKAGFRGEECSDINECTENLHSCNDNQFCNNTFGGYICICKQGFKPTPDGKSCIDINECLEMAGGGMAYPLSSGSGLMNTNPFDDFSSSSNGYGPPRQSQILNSNMAPYTQNLRSGQGPCDARSQICENIIGSYFCRCRRHYDTIDNSNPRMPICRLIDLCNRNGMNPCGGGTCRINENPPYYTCVCPKQSVQVNSSFCATPKYCDAQFPCPPESYCKNGNCECNPGFQWPSLPAMALYDANALRNRQSCKPINPCTLPQPPCKRDQFCKYIGPGVYECICPLGYIYSRTTGNCENVNECLNATIICPKNSDCYDTPGSFRCVCNRGFRNVAPPTAPRPFCQDINECLNIFSYTCGMYQHCVNDEGSYHCECNYGFYATQINPLVCQDIDECNNATVRMCSTDAKCTNTPGSFFCTCNVGFYGDGKYCKNINECDPMRFIANCSGPREQCEDTIGSYKCSCKQGFERRNGFCENIDECNMNLHNCNTFGLKMKMECIDKVPGFLCRCPMGFRWNPSTRDCEDIDECTIPYMNNCTMFHARCRNTYGSFACDCFKGFMRDPTCPAVLCPCVNINECLNYTACAPNAICQDMTPGYLCTCNMGYLGDGYKQCRPFDQCVATTAKCGQEQKCIVSNQKPFCTCVDPRKFLPNEDNSRCLGNPCAIDNGGCVRPSACLTTIRNGRFEASCRCPPGYLPGVDNPRRCDPINGCGCPGNGRSCESIRCPTKSRCYNVAAGQFLCICKPGFKKVGDSCLDIDECREGLPGRPRVCEFDCKNLIGSFECSCPVGKISGMLGKCVADPQCLKQDQCNYVPNSYCNYFKGNDSFLCECKNGFTGIPTVACNPVQFCTRNPCPSDEICIDTYRSFRCDCKPGFQRGPRGCVDIDECLQNLCPKGQLCNNTVGSYFCGCYQGYRMSNLGSCIDVNECTEKLHNCNPTTEICINYAPGFSCQCRFPQFVAVNNTCINNDECKTGFNTCPMFSICIDTYGGYNCSCMRGTVPRFDTQNNRLLSCDDFDECKGPIPACDVNAICKNHYAGYSCQCRPGYFGSGSPGNCFEKQLCPGQCGPNAYCLRNQFSIYNCTCAPDFRGDGRVCEEIDKCKEMKCNKLAQCKRVNRGTFICQCQMPYEGDGLNYCTRIQFCQRSYHDCPFGSSCIELEKMGNDGRWYQCKCPPGLYFNETTRFCQDVRECEQRPSVCPIEATCVEKIGTYMCMCSTGYIYNFRKNTCDDINECLMPSLCQPFGRCENMPGSYRCICNAGFRWNERLRTCMDINECTENLHQCDTKSSVCYNLIGSYTCACKFGFQSVPGTSPQKCEDKDECRTSEHSCSSYAKCINTFGSYTCKCLDTYSGDGFVCFEIPTCTNLKCGQNAVCIELSPRENFKNPVCTCKNGYESKNPAQGCTMVDLCLKLNNPCGKAIGQCRPLPSSYNCTCNKGYYFNGFTCVDFDECKSPGPVCGENAICKNTIGSYNCTCIQGFDGDPYVMCKPIDLCTTTDVRFRKQCSEQGYCFDNACVCKAGFTGDGVICNNINECLLPGICNTFAICKDTIGSYMCICRLGFSGDGSVCNDIDECSNITMPCDMHADCTNTQGSFVCSCKKGWDAMNFDKPPSGAPQTCQNVNECLSPYLNLCDPKTSRCFDTPGDYECQCLSGYKRPTEADKRTCIDIDECAQGKCDAVTSTCVNTPGSYTCVCKTGFTRSAMDPNSCIDINECLQSPCDPHATCENLIGSFKCTCNKGYKGDGFQCKIINPCTDPTLDPCDKATSVCNFTEAQGAYCSCLSGFEQVPTASGRWTCQDIEECDPIRPRHLCNLTKEHCVNLPGGYRCDCNEGYKKVGTECVEINECEEPENQGINFCLVRKAFCIDILRGFRCKCHPGYTKVGSENDFVCTVQDPCRGKNNCTGNTKCKRASLKVGYICECADGFTQATNPTTGEKYCRASLQPCTKNTDCPEHCQCDAMKGFCQTDRGYRFATSPDGSFKKSPDGKFLVVDIDECKESQNTCSEGCQVEGLKCQNTIGSFSCLCPNGKEARACKCESACKTKGCPWNRQCYEKGLDSIDCNCREMPAGERPNQEICMKEGAQASYYPHPIFFYNQLCQVTEDDCGFPENEADIQKARDFNYFGQCQFDIAAVKCEFGVKPVRRGSTIFCDYPPETRSYLSKNCTSTTNVR